MKKFNEILQTIEETKQAHTTKASESLDAFYKEIDAIARIKARRNGDADFLTREKKLLDAASEEEKRNEENRVKIAILTENARRAFFAENIGKICEIWNGYAGKKYGEKTAEKIREDLATATGAGVWIHTKYGETNINIFLQKGTGADVLGTGATDLTAYAKTPITDDENRIKPLDASQCVLHFCGAYVDDVGAHVAKFYEAREALKAAEENAKQARAAYNELTRGTMKRTTAGESFPARIF